MFAYPLIESQIREYLQNSQGYDHKSKIFKVVSETMEVVGHIGLGTIDKKNATASICRVFIDPEYRGKGI